MGLIICAALTLSLAVLLQRRDGISKPRPHHGNAEDGGVEKGYDGQEVKEVRAHGQVVEGCT